MDLLHFYRMPLFKGHILPAIAALQVAKSFRKAMIISLTVAVFSVLIGMAVSFFGDFQPRRHCND